MKATYSRAAEGCRSLAGIAVYVAIASHPSPAKALSFSFNFQSDLNGFSPNTPINTPGDVTGIIGGLIDNATSAATSITLTSFPEVFNTTFGIPIGTTGTATLPPIDILPLATAVAANSFTVINGNIADVNLVLLSSTLPGPFWTFALSCGTICTSQTPPEPDFNLLFDVFANDSKVAKLAANSLGKEGVTFTPVPGPLPILGLGAALGASRQLKKRNRGTKFNSLTIKQT